MLLHKFKRVGRCSLDNQIVSRLGRMIMSIYSTNKLLFGNWQLYTSRI